MKTDNELIEDFWISKGGNPHDPADLWFYESDWSMLMPVVFKAKATPHSANYGSWNILNMYLIAIDLKNVYAELVEFIKWYNSHEKTS